MLWGYFTAQQPKNRSFLELQKKFHVCTKHIPPKHYRNIFFLKTSFNIFSVLNQAEILQDRFVPLSKYWKKELLFTESSILKISTKNVQFFGFLLKKVKKKFHIYFSDIYICQQKHIICKGSLRASPSCGVLNFLKI